MAREVLMRDYDVCIIGGGIGGCSALYHLTREGRTNCVLFERDELTSGTTWHSAAQVTNFGFNQTMIGLKSHSIRLYRELSADISYPVSYYADTGGLRLATTESHLDGYHHFVSLARSMGVDFEVIDAAECARRHPLLSTDDLLGALWDPHDGDIDPAQLCQSLARRSRLAGADIIRSTPVINLTQHPDDTWTVHTSAGDFRCEIVVNAGGYRCNEVGAMMGVTHPVVSMEHQYMVTESLPEIEALGDDFRCPLLRCPSSNFYQRAEKRGLLIGFYEQDCRPWGLDGIDPNFSMSLCPDDLDRVVDVMSGAISRLPCLESAGIHTIVNGPITYTPDGLPLVGKVPGVRNAYCITGLRAGLGEGGGHGWLLAQMIVHGEAEYDTWCLDPCRFGDYANTEYTTAKAIEDYRNEFSFHLPHEHRPAGRPLRTTPLTPRLTEQSAEFGVVNGWERVMYFRPSPDFTERHSFKFSNTFDIVASEIESLCSGVGIMEVSGFCRYELSGADLHASLDNLTCTRLNARPDSVTLAYFLNEFGCVKSEATLSNIQKDCVWYGSAAASEVHDYEWLRSHLPREITITPLTESHTTLVIAGPNSRSLLSSVCPDTDWSRDSFGWMRCRRVKIGNAGDIIALSVSYSGELSWELHIPNEHLVSVYDALVSAGDDYDLRHFGLLATESMRLEKGYRHWKADLLTEFTAYESGLDRFVDTTKNFVGCSALESSPLRHRFVSLTLDSSDAPAHSGDSILYDGEVCGSVTSAGWGYRTSKNIALGFLRNDSAIDSSSLSVQVLGDIVSAREDEMCRYDPKNILVRG